MEEGKHVNDDDNGREKREYEEIDERTNVLLFTIVVALRIESHLKSTQFFAIREDPLTRSHPGPRCVAPFAIPSARIRGYLRALRSAPISCATFGKRYDRRRALRINQ